MLVIINYWNIYIYIEIYDALEHCCSNIISYVCLLLLALPHYPNVLGLTTGPPRQRICWAKRNRSRWRFACWARHAPWANASAVEAAPKRSSGGGCVWLAGSFMWFCSFVFSWCFFWYWMLKLYIESNKWDSNPDWLSYAFIFSYGPTTRWKPFTSIRTASAATSAKNRWPGNFTSRRGASRAQKGSKSVSNCRDHGLNMIPWLEKIYRKYDQIW